MSQTKVKSGLLNFPDQTDFVKLPSGTTAQRPSSPEEGYSRYNTTDNKLEYWNGTIWQQLPGIVPPIITSISYPGDDLAADPAGGQTITINGGDFKAGATVTVDGTAPSVITFVSANQITFTAPAKAAGDYDIVVTNVDGGNGTAVDGMTYNGLPSWTTPAGSLGVFKENTTIPTITLVAAEPDSGAISYSITTGGLPTGLTLSGADIDGTTPTVTGETTYNFTVTATDNENQSIDRSFNIVVYKFVPSFNTVVYSGNGTSQPITGVGFQPDFVWIKDRTAAYHHILQDSVRGVNSKLGSDGTWEENNSAELSLSYGQITSFDSDGFSVNGSIQVNTSGTNNMVAWCWRAGGAAVTNTDGTITSQVSANVDTGFSVVSYTGNGVQGATVGHGLNSAPQFIIAKGRGNVGSWRVGNSAIGWQYYMNLDGNSQAFVASSIWNSTSPTSSVFSLGNNADANGNGQTKIAYCFAEVAGFSKFGSYTGTGSAGNTVTLGFEPAFVMVKRTDGAQSWGIYDNKRTGGGAGETPQLLADSPGVEYYEPLILTATGFRLDGAESIFNGSGMSYIYMAFANQF